VTFSEVARAVLDAALAADARPVEITVTGRRVGVVVRDHRVIVEISGGVLRVVWVDPTPGCCPRTRDLRVALDDADKGVVGGMVRRAIEEGVTPL
jgi:hypothetical protein